MTFKRDIHIVWFKRDFRWHDHAPIRSALASGENVLFVALHEPSLWNEQPYDERHERFLWDSIRDLNEIAGKEVVYFLKVEALEFFKRCLDNFRVKAVYSHRETGIGKTFARDKDVASLLNAHDVSWNEWDYGGVKRGLKHRRNWLKDWYDYVDLAPLRTDISAVQALALPNPFESWQHSQSFEPHPYFQKGGASRGERVLYSFLTERIKRYAQSISKPLASRKGCSRISPHLAWGNLSIRQVWHMAEVVELAGSKRNQRAFVDRLRWQAHFIQKFESACSYEFHPINSAYTAIDASKIWDQQKFDAWKNGTTGVPLVDACMRCVAATGYLNFRMRAMVVSFYSQYLWLPWEAGARYLASTFTDFEPGIHYTQFQMQSGYTGVNTIRIYNPIKQSFDQDPKGDFIKQWLPELKGLPLPYLHEPWAIPPMMWEMEQWNIGSYPKHPIVDLSSARKHASDQLYGIKKTKASKLEAQLILEKLVNPRAKKS
ncbi:MAG: deoxyribodipyrimidine photo-lyase [Schleiferiaceae bacterium]|nr:deoxyribodipyrimidine photo-lyase [Schleiferiaceae bacterium]